MRSRAVLLASLVVLAATSTFAATRNAAWIPPWNANALTSLQQNAGAITEANPVWYSWNPDGSILKNWNAENPTWRAAMTGAEIVPTIQNIVNQSFNATVVANVLSSATSREAHANAIVQLVTTNAFDGIDIDYESLPATQKANFTALVQSLAQKLHAVGKKLSVTVYPKQNANATWDGPGAEDYAAIGAVADSVKIMAYDYHHDASAPGAVTPLDWLDKVATYAETLIPSSKILIGLPWYGYDWPASGTASTATFASATQVALNNGVTPTRDASGEMTYTYNGRTVFYSDATSYQLKVNVIKQKHPAIAGFAHWAVGMEDPASWTVLRGGFTSTYPTNPAPGGGGSSPAQPLPADFTISGPDTVAVKAGTAATSTYKLVPINGFSGTASVSVAALDAFDGSLIPSASTVTNGANVSLRVSTNSTTAAGTYRVAVRFTSGTMVREQIVKLVVASALRTRTVKH